MEAERQEVWVTAQRHEIHVSNMTTQHIQNTIKMLKGEGSQPIPDRYFKTRKKWIAVFTKELKRRHG